MGQIKEFYTGKIVLLTGATGLMGKVLMEKILTDLPDIGRLYLLIRPKSLQDGTLLSANDRLWFEILQSTAFQELRLLHKDNFNSWIEEKVQTVSGDLSIEQIGLDQETRKQLQQEVDVIINCAAVVSFDARLDDALSLNTVGPKRMIEFARGCRKAIIAHVSTCFVNGTSQGPIYEQPLPDQPPAKSGKPQEYDVIQEVTLIKQAISNLESSSHGFVRQLIFKLHAYLWRDNLSRDNESLDERIEKLRLQWNESQLVTLGTRWARYRGWTDTYTFTKAMGEQIICREKGDIPTVIVRPAIIEASIRRPQPGWLDGFRMLDPLIVAYGRGALPNFPGNPNTILDIVPADLVINAVLGITSSKKATQTNPIFHIATGMENPILLKEFTELVEEYFQWESLSSRGNIKKNLPKVTFPSRQSFLRKVKIYLKLVRFISVIAKPFTLIPFMKKLGIWSQTRYSNLRRLEYYLRIYGPYCEISCKYMTHRLKEVWDDLDSEDQTLCNFDVNQIDWREYVQKIYIPGLKHFLLGVPSPTQIELNKPQNLSTQMQVNKEDLDTVPKDEEQPKPTLRYVSERELSQWTGNSFPKNVTRKLTRTVLTLVFRFYLRLHCNGLENIPNFEPFIIATNHTSHLDTGAILAVLGDKASNLKPLAAQDYFFRNRLWSWAFDYFVGAIPLDRKSHSEDSLGLAAGLLRENHSILMFPEGGRSLTGEIQPFKGGIGRLALASKVPIVPAYIRGTFQAMPKGHAIIRPRRIEVQFGAPIKVQNYLNNQTNEGSYELSRRLTTDIQQAVEALS